MPLSTFRSFPLRHRSELRFCLRSRSERKTGVLRYIQSLRRLRKYDTIRQFYYGKALQPFCTPVRPLLLHTQVLYRRLTLNAKVGLYVDYRIVFSVNRGYIDYTIAPVTIKFIFKNIFLVSFVFLNIILSNERYRILQKIVYCEHHKHLYCFLFQLKIVEVSKQ